MGIELAVMVPHPPLIIPEVGKGEENGIRRTIDAYEEAAKRIGQLRPETILLLSPHQTMYADYFHISPGQGAKGDFARFGAGEVKFDVSYDTEFVQGICDLADRGLPDTDLGESGTSLPAGTLGERDRALDHGTMVPLYFVNRYWKDYKLVRVGLSGLPLITHYELGRCIQAVSERLGRRTAIIASGDLSHRLKEDGPYGFRPEGPEYDERIMDVMGTARFPELFDFSEEFCERAGECGHRSFTIMAGALDGRAVRAEALSHEGPFGVGYGVCVYEVSGVDESRRFGRQYEEKIRQKLRERKAQEDSYVRLARRTIEEYTLTGRKPVLSQEEKAKLPREMRECRAGVFVSIKKDGRLRGCIGTIEAVRDSVLEEILENAVSACSRDPRFSPVGPEELERLSISVDVLGETESIASPAQLDVKRYGVIVTKGYKRGLLLPNLEGVDTVEEQIAIARQKAGIREDEKVELERFEVVRHGL